MVESAQVRFNLIQEIGGENAHGKIWIARTDDEHKQLCIVKEPNNRNDARDLELEFVVFDAIGKHDNVMGVIEYHDKSPIYMALEFAKAKCLYNYLKFYASD